MHVEPLRWVPPQGRCAAPLPPSVATPRRHTAMPPAPPQSWPSWRGSSATMATAGQDGGHAQQAGAWPRTQLAERAALERRQAVGERPATAPLPASLLPRACLGVAFFFSADLGAMVAEGSRRGGRSGRGRVRASQASRPPWMVQMVPMASLKAGRVATALLGEGRKSGSMS